MWLCIKRDEGGKESREGEGRYVGKVKAWRMRMGMTTGWYSVGFSALEIFRYGSPHVTTAQDGQV